MCRMHDKDESPNSLNNVCKTDNVYKIDKGINTNAELGPIELGQTDSRQTDSSSTDSSSTDSSSTDSRVIDLDLAALDLTDLVQKAQSGETQSCLELLRRFAPLMDKWQRRLAQRLPYEDKAVLQSEVRFAVLLLIIEFDAERGVPFEGYMCGMLARRLANQNKLRRHAVTMTFSEAALALGIKADEVPDCSHSSIIFLGTVDSMPDKCWCHLWWQEAMALLPPRQQQVIQLVLEGYTEREIAERIGVHHTTVSEYKKKARKKLQEFWSLYPCKTSEKSI